MNDYLTQLQHTYYDIKEMKFNKGQKRQNIEKIVDRIADDATLADFIMAERDGLLLRLPTLFKKTELRFDKDGLYLFTARGALSSSQYRGENIASVISDSIYSSKIEAKLIKKKTLKTLKKTLNYQTSEKLI
jgi:hypothetical protein